MRARQCIRTAAERCGVPNVRLVQNGVNARGKARFCWNSAEMPRGCLSRLLRQPIIRLLVGRTNRWKGTGCSPLECVRAFGTLSCNMQNQFSSTMSQFTAIVDALRLTFNVAKLFSLLAWRRSLRASRIAAASQAIFKISGLPPLSSIFSNLRQTSE